MSDEVENGAKKSKLKGCVLWGAGLIVVFVLLVAIFGPEADQSSGAKDAQSGNDAGDMEAISEALPVVQATDLIAAYQQNEMRAQKQYGDMKMRFEGTVSNIQSDFSDAPLISLSSDDNEFMTANVGLDKDYSDYASNLSKGQRVAFICEGSREVIGFPQLKDCVPAN